MKTENLILSAVFAAAVLTTGALAQTAPDASAPRAPAPDRIVYVPQLPTAGDLLNAGKAQGLTVSRIEQTSDSVSVAYASSTGQVTTVLYRPISAADEGSAPAAPQAPAAPYAPAAPSAAPAAAPAAATTVVYTTPAYPYPYGYPYGYYNPWWDWAPVAVAVGFGLGWEGGHGWAHGGGFHGGGYRR